MPNLLAASSYRHFQILQYNVTGDCENLNVGAVYLQVSGDTPPFAVNCISPSCRGVRMATSSTNKSSP